MKTKFRLHTLIAISIFALAACSRQGSTSVSPDDTAITAVRDAASEIQASEETAPAEAKSEPQVLVSRDKAVSIGVNGNFQDQSGNAELMPEKIDNAEVTLLQQDAGADIVLTVTDFGKPAKPAKDYYAGLKTALEGSSLQNLKIGAATENRMDYSFSDGGKSENCIAIYHPDNLYSVCATSQTADNNRLAEMLKDVKLLKKAM